MQVIQKNHNSLRYNTLHDCMYLGMSGTTDAIGILRNDAREGETMTTKMTTWTSKHNGRKYIEIGGTRTFARLEDARAPGRIVRVRRDEMVALFSRVA